MKVTKIVMCLVGVCSMFIALFNTQSIVTILMFCFTLRAAGSFFPYVMDITGSKPPLQEPIHP